VPHFEPDENKCSLEIHGLDATSLMSLEEKIKDWPNKTDSDIAREIFQQGYNLTPEVEDTSVAHDEAVATIIQRETDIQFLKRLARRNGFECFVQAEKGFFRKPTLDDEQQPPLSIHFGNETNLISLEARVNALRPTAVEMRQFDTIGKEIINTVAESGQQRRLGRDSALSITPPDGLAPRLFVRHAVTTGQPEMDNLCRAMFDEAEWFVEAHGEVDGALYCGSLRARKPAPVRGVGELFSGLYYVTSVRHIFTPDRYTQRFTARRNALAPSGDEDFGDGDSLLGGLV
jgi:hypothetical protein